MSHSLDFRQPRCSPFTTGGFKTCTRTERSPFSKRAGGFTPRTRMVRSLDLRQPRCSPFTMGRFKICTRTKPMVLSTHTRMVRSPDLRQPRCSPPTTGRFKTSTRMVRSPVLDLRQPRRRRARMPCHRVSIGATYDHAVSNMRCQYRRFVDRCISCTSCLRVIKGKIRLVDTLDADYSRAVSCFCFLFLEFFRPVLADERKDERGETKAESRRNSREKGKTRPVRATRSTDR